MVVAPAFCRLFSPQCVGARFSASPTKERRGARISCRLPSIRPIINTLFVHSNGLGVTPILDPRGPGAILPAEVFYASSRISFRFSVYCRGTERAQSESSPFGQAGGRRTGVAPGGH